MYTYIDCVVTEFDDKKATITIQTVDGSEEGVVEASKVRLKKQQLEMPFQGAVLLEVKESVGPGEEPADVTEVISPWGSTLQVPKSERRGILSVEKEVEDTEEYSRRGMVIRVIALLIILAGIIVPHGVLHLEGPVIWLVFSIFSLSGMSLLYIAP